MAIIIAEGLFNGRRLRACSDKARLLWPYLFLASNGFGRLEIDYEFILRNFFVDFRNFPKPNEFFGIIREYHDNGLMFLYENGAVWGQWDCKSGSLPRYQTAKDRKSPAPDKIAFEEWKKAYALKTNILPKISEIFGKFPLGIGDGIGIGEGVGEENKKPEVAAAAGKEHPTLRSNGKQPDFPPMDGPDPQQTIRLAIEELADGMWPNPGSVPRARSAAEHEWSSAGAPEVSGWVSGILERAKEWKGYHLAQRQSSKGWFIPSIERWFVDGDYSRHPPELAPSGNGKKKTAVEVAQAKEAARNGNH